LKKGDQIKLQGSTVGGVLAKH